MHYTLEDVITIDDIEKDNDWGIRLLGRDVYAGSNLDSTIKSANRGTKVWRLTEIVLGSKSHFSVVDNEGVRFDTDYIILKKEEPFAIGDKAKVIADRHEKSHLGKVGNIVDIDLGGFYKVSFNDRASIWYSSFEIKPVKEENKEEKAESKEEKSMTAEDIAKKKECKTYVPFDFSMAKDRDALRDRWIKRGFGDDHEYKVTAFKFTEDGWRVHVPTAGLRSAEQLFTFYKFIDGSVCGKEVADEKIGIAID